MGINSAGKKEMDGDMDKLETSDQSFVKLSLLQAHADLLRKLFLSIIRFFLIFLFMPIFCISLKFWKKILKKRASTLSVMVINKIKITRKKNSQWTIYMRGDLFRDVILFDNQVVTSPPVCRRHDFLSDLERTFWKRQGKIIKQI